MRLQICLSTRWRTVISGAGSRNAATTSAIITSAPSTVVKRKDGRRFQNNGFIMRMRGSRLLMGLHLCCHISSFFRKLYLLLLPLLLCLLNLPVTHSWISPSVVEVRRVGPVVLSMSIPRCSKGRYAYGSRYRLFSCPRSMKVGVKSHNNDPCFDAKHIESLVNSTTVKTGEDGSLPNQWISSLSTTTSSGINNITCAHSFQNETDDDDDDDDDDQMNMIEDKNEVKPLVSTGPVASSSSSSSSATTIGKADRSSNLLTFPSFNFPWTKSASSTGSNSGMVILMDPDAVITDSMPIVYYDGPMARFKERISQLLSEPWVEIVMCSAVLVSCLLVAIDTLPNLSTPVHGTIRGLLFFVGWLFLTDLVARVLASPTPEQYLTKPSFYVEAVAVICPLVLGSSLLSSSGTLNTLTASSSAVPTGSFLGSNNIVIPSWLASPGTLINFELLRVVRLQRILKDLETFTKFEMALMGGGRWSSISPVKEWQLQLARVFTSLFTLLSVATGLIYTAEHESNPAITDYFTALYFGLTTLTTVGFGDITPVTWEGKLVVSLSILAGVAVIPTQGAALVEALLARQEENLYPQNQPPVIMTPSTPSQRQKQEEESSSSSSFASTSSTLTAATSGPNPNPLTFSPDSGTRNASNDESTNNDGTTVGLNPTASSIGTRPTTAETRTTTTLVSQRERSTTEMSFSVPSSLVCGSPMEHRTASAATMPQQQQQQWVLEMTRTCPTCKNTMHWSTARYCWSCGSILTLSDL